MRFSFSPPGSHPLTLSLACASPSSLSPTNRRPYLATHCNSLREAEKWRLQVLCRFSCSLSLFLLGRLCGWRHSKRSLSTYASNSLRLSAKFQRKSRRFRTVRQPKTISARRLHHLAIRLSPVLQLFSFPSSFQ